MDVHVFPRCIYATKTCIIWRIVKTWCKRVQSSLKKRYATYMCRRCFIINTRKWFFSPPFHPQLLFLIITSKWSIGQSKLTKEELIDMNHFPGVHVVTQSLTSPFSKATIFNGDFQKKIYIEQLEGFTHEGEHLVCKLHKSLYRLKQSLGLGTKS
jgi:hypothetical protein